MNKIVEKFLDLKINLYKTKNTYINYKIDLSQLDLHMSRKLGKDWVETATNDDMALYIKYLKDSNYEVASINRKIASASKFFKYCVDSDYRVKNPMSGIELFDLPVKIKKPLLIDDIRKMIELTYTREIREKNYEFASARNRFIMALLATTGLRISELMNINMYKLEKIEAGYMVNISSSDTKGKVNKRVPIANKTLEYFDEYMIQREKCGFSDRDILVLSRTGKEMTRNSVQKMLDKYTERAGITEIEVTPHVFRHTCTGILRRNRVEDSLIYNILGWKEGIMATYTDDITSLDEAKIECCNIL